MLKYRFFKIIGVWILGFAASLASTTPLQPDFDTQLILSAFGGFVTVLPQVGKMMIEYGDKNI